MGVRICIPLDRITKVSYHWQAGSIPVTALTVDVSENSESTTPAESATEGITPQVIELAAHKMNEHWQELEELVNKAKHRAQKDSKAYVERPVVVDVGFGLLDEVVRQPDPDVDHTGEYAGKTKEEVICDLLGIEYEPDVWGVCSSFIVLICDSNQATNIHLVTRACLSTAPLSLPLPSLLSPGFFVLSPHWIGFYSKSIFPARNDVQYRLPASGICGAIALRNSNTPRMQLDIEGHPSLRFLFRSETTRDEAVRRVQELVQVQRTGTNTILHAPLTTSPGVSRSASASSDTSFMSPSLSPSTTSSPAALPSARAPTPASTLLAPLGKSFPSLRASLDAHKVLQLPKAVNPPPSILSPSSTPGVSHFIRLKPKPAHYVCLTIGSRGDVQPYISLGLGLKRDGHRVTVVTHAEYKDWIEGFGLAHRVAGGDPGMLMQLSVENKVRLRSICHEQNNAKG